MWVKDVVDREGIFGARAYKCFAASKPRPVFAPVMMTVFPAKLVVGMGGVWHCPERNCLISAALGAIGMFMEKFVKSGVKVDKSGDAM
jgi:hypothetical protein